MKVEITTAGLERLTVKAERRLEYLKGNNEMRRFLQEAGKQLVEEYKATIRSFTPGPVQDLSAKYKVQKSKAVGRIYPILERTGALLRSMVPRVTDKGRQRWTLAVTYRGIHPEANMKNSRLARLHITGEGNLPARDFTRPSNQWRAQLMARLRASVRKKK